jgi:hypothetical protein
VCHGLIRLGKLGRCRGGGSLGGERVRIVAEGSFGQARTSFAGRNELPWGTDDSGGEGLGWLDESFLQGVLEILAPLRAGRGFGMCLQGRVAGDGQGIDADRVSEELWLKRFRGWLGF